MEILGKWEESPAELDVLGTHGRSGIARLVLGSAAERIARHALCSALHGRVDIARCSIPRDRSVPCGSDRRCGNGVRRRLPPR